MTIFAILFSSPAGSPLSCHPVGPQACAYRSSCLLTGSRCCEHPLSGEHMTKWGTLLFPCPFPHPEEAKETRLDQIKWIYHFELLGRITGHLAGLGSKPATPTRAKSGRPVSSPLGRDWHGL